MENYLFDDSQAQIRGHRTNWILLVMIILGWMVEVLLINRMYNTITVSRGYELYGQEEKVKFEENMYAAKQYAEGCAIKVNNAYIVDYDTYVNENRLGASENDWSDRKILIIEVTLSAEEKDMEEFSVYELECHGIDSRILQDWSLLSQVNPRLDENMRLSLQKGESQQLKLPFVIYKTYMEKAWENLDQYPIYFRVTIAMIKKEILIKII